MTFETEDEIKGNEKEQKVLPKGVIRVLRKCAAWDMRRLLAMGNLGHEVV